MARYIANILKSGKTDDGSYLTGGLPLLVLVLLILIALSGTIAAAFAHDGDDTLSQWYRSLHRPDTGGSCCTQGTGQFADCAETDYQVRDGAYWAMTPKGNWVEIPPARILANTGNPTGRAVLCWMEKLGVLCFVSPSES